MLHMNAYRAVKDVYMVGKHANITNDIHKGLLSLHYLATAAKGLKILMFN